MKIAILYKGLCKNKILSLKEIYDNHKENIYGDSIYDIYFHTYEDYEFLDLKELINVFKPKKFITTNSKELDSYEKNEYYSTKSMCNSIKNVINLLDNTINYDFIIITRFDIFLNYKINYNLFNKNYFYSSFCTNRKVQDDNLFIFHNKLYINKILYLCDRRLRKKDRMCGLHRSIDVIGFNNCKFLQNSKGTPHKNNNIYKILRK